MDTETRELLRRFRHTLHATGLTEAQCQARLAQVTALHEELEQDLAGILQPAPEAYKNERRNAYALRRNRQKPFQPILSASRRAHIT